MNELALFLQQYGLHVICGLLALSNMAAHRKIGILKQLANPTLPRDKKQKLLKKI